MCCVQERVIPCFDPDVCFANIGLERHVHFLTMIRSHSKTLSIQYSSLDVVCSGIFFEIPWTYWVDYVCHRSVWTTQLLELYTEVVATSSSKTAEETGFGFCGRTSTSHFWATLTGYVCKRPC